MQYIVRAIQRGECCSVVGISNVGKSFLLRSLTLEAIRQGCTDPGNASLLIVFVDCLEACDSEQAFYELVVRRMLEDAEVCRLSASEASNLRTNYQGILHSTTDVAVRAFFYETVRDLTRERQVRLVLILDEFDDVFRRQPARVFRQLRALRDEMEDRLCYITATSRQLDKLRSDADTYEFRELFHLRELVLTPLSDEDAGRFVAYLASNRATILPLELNNLIIRESGGHPGLMVRIHDILCSTEASAEAPSQNLMAGLLDISPVSEECGRLWDELDKAEQDALLDLVAQGHTSLDAEQVLILKTKGLITTGKNQPLTIYSPIFALFVKRVWDGRQAKPKRIHYDVKTGQVWAGDYEVTLELSEPQRKLVATLCEKSGAICTYDQIAARVWGTGEGVSPGAIYELVKRVRQKVEPDWKNPRYIVTVPGVGYRLESPNQ
ncbi:MAG: winged helix-turn-helix domain-containing protein [Chloroflexi bacterium]|nr:winged helix-turn-helix domain-containing protein [Chloroflexota bacterium]